jgi:hypothetical protein
VICAAFNFFFSEFTLIKLEPMPASQARITFLTWAAEIDLDILFLLFGMADALATMTIIARLHLPFQLYRVSQPLWIDMT